MKIQPCIRHTLIWILYYNVINNPEFLTMHSNMLLQRVVYFFLLYTHLCSQSWYCRFHRVWSDAPDHNTVVFWINIIPLWNRWRSTQRFSQYVCMRYCDVVHIAPYKICTKYFISFQINLQILLLSINASFWMIFNSRPSSGVIVRIKKNNNSNCALLL